MGMMMCKQKNILVPLVLVMSVGATQVVNANEESPNPQRRIEEVAITAQKRSQSMQVVPITVSAFSGEMLTASGVSSTQDLQLVTPGLVYNNTNAWSQPYLRGVGTRLAQNGLDSSVATYIDDRYSPRTSGNIFDFADIERIEVLKGPQGTLFGRNATGGAIRIIRKGVSNEFEGNVKAVVGNYNQRDISGTVSIPITADFGVRITGLSKERDGYVDNIYSGVDSNGNRVVDELDNQDFKAFSTKFRWDASENLVARLTLDYWSQNDNSGNDQHSPPPLDRNVGVALGGITGTDSSEVAASISDEFDGEQFGSELKLDYNLESFDLVSITTYLDHDYYLPSDNDGTSVDALDAWGYDESETYSQELQLLSNGASSFDWLLGAQYYFDDQTTDILLDTLVIPTLSQGNQTTETAAWAVFGQTTFDINQSWSLTLGGRYSVEERKVLVEPTPNAKGFSTAGGPLLPFKADEEWKEFTPKATLEYHLSDTMLYLTYARGFKSGGFNYPAISTPEGLEPEILDMVEFGLKGDYLNETLRLNAAMFLYDYKDLQVSRASAAESSLVVTENAADATIRGLDLELTWTPADRFTLQTGLSLLDTEYDKYPANAKVFRQNQPGMTDVFFDAKGHDLLRAPDWTAFMTASYDFQVPNGTLPVSLTYSYKDDFYFDFVADPLAEDLKADGYGILNARASYLFDNQWSVSVWGRNLTDEEYFDDFVAYGMGLRASYGAPKTYGAEVEHRF